MGRGGEKSFAPISLEPLLNDLLLLQRFDDLADLADTLQLRYADFPRIWRAGGVAAPDAAGRRCPGKRCRLPHPKPAE